MMHKIATLIALSLFSANVYAACPEPKAHVSEDVERMKSTSGKPVYLVPVMKKANIHWKAVQLDGACHEHVLSVEDANDDGLFTQAGEDARILCHDIDSSGSKLECESVGTKSYSLEHEYRVTDTKLQLLKITRTLKDSGESTIEYERKT